MWMTRKVRAVVTHSEKGAEGKGAEPACVCVLKCSSCVLALALMGRDCLVFVYVWVDFAMFGRPVSLSPCAGYGGFGPVDGKIEVLSKIPHEGEVNRCVRLSLLTPSPSVVSSTTLLPLSPSDSPPFSNPLLPL